MTEEEKKAIEDLKSNIKYAKECGREDTYTNQETIYIVLNLIQKQQSELEKKDIEITKLKKHNKDLLRKLRSRVKEVKKLTKYSLYKREFTTLNKQLQQKDKMIDEISKNPYNELKVNGILFTGTDIKQYFEKKVIPEEK